uniref:THO complex subunit 5 n=1 Tax=Caenorhabditis tropicalis TaxID=1561998 RepID=A0A1I7TML9_9PELO
MSVNVRPSKRVTEEPKKEEVKLSENATKLLESISKVDTAEKLFSLEDRIAMEMTHDQIFREFKEDYQFINKVLEEYLEGKKIDTSSIAKIARLRRNTRLCHYATAQMRKEVAERMEIVDAKLLQLQNVTSEVQHIQKEIDRCLDFSAGDEGLELIPVEQFYSEAPTSLSRADETMGNEHEQYLVRLKYEDDQRRDLLSTLNELEGRRNVLQSDIRGKEVRLQGLKPKLEDLAKVAEPVFDIVGAKFKDLTIDGEQQKLSLTLPAPLAVAHIHANAYKEIHDDKLFDVRIVGNNETTKQSKDDAETKRRRKDDETTQEKINELASKIMDVHPMSLEFNIECSNDLKITLSIQYLTELKVLTAKWNVHADSKIKKSVLFSDESLMSDLFDDDSGDKCPNKVGDLKIEHLKLNFNSSLNKTGKPYKFIQELCGSEGETDGIAHCEDETFIASIPSSLSERIAKSGSADRFPYKIEAVDGNNKKITAYISVPSDYPRHAALFGIDASQDSSSETVKEIEERLNNEAFYVDNVNSIREQLNLLLKHIDLS